MKINYDFEMDEEKDEKPQRKSGDVIYCSVTFSEDGNTYYYQTMDEGIQVGDRVVVPVGQDNIEQVAVVKKIECFEQDRLPFPLEKTKHIIGKKQEKEEHIAPAPINNLVLCDENNHFIKIMVWAEMNDGCLRISGQDLGKDAGFVVDEDEYEYFYDFDLENTERLFALLSPESQKQQQIFRQKFSGLVGCRNLREFCKDNDIAYRFFSC